MIQTQLLRLDPPYQIISAGGRVGIQVATLIVTEDKTTEDGDYAIDTHSHPIVNYGLKQGVEEALKYDNGIDEIAHNRLLARLQPEGAVWNKVEVGDVRVLGLAGAKNEPISLAELLNLVPHAPNSYAWDSQSVSRLYELHYNLIKVGLNIEIDDNNLNWNLPIDSEGTLHVKLELLLGTVPLVRVMIRDEKLSPYPWEVIGFSVRLFNEEVGNTNKCEELISSAMRELKSNFHWKNLTFSHHKQTDSPLEDLVENVTGKINAAFNLK